MPEISSCVPVSRGVSAIAVVRRDKTALLPKDLQDPFGSGPFSYNRREGGFELVSKLIDRNGNPLTLTVGRTR